MVDSSQDHAKGQFQVFGRPKTNGPRPSSLACAAGQAIGGAGPRTRSIEIADLQERVIGFEPTTTTLATLCSTN